MTRTKAPEFSGFPSATMSFLEELAANNERAWFQANKHLYEEDVLAPALEFIGAMGPRLERISQHFVAIPKRVGGSLIRVYRDTRFSRNKTPYKTNIGIQFRHEFGKDIHAPGFYVHIEPSVCFLGAGLWRPGSSALTAIRDSIVDDSSGWKRARNAKRFRERFTLSGDRLKRPPLGYPADHPCIEDLKRKDFIGVLEFDIRETSNRAFPDQVATDFAAAKPLMRFLCGALELRF